MSTHQSDDDLISLFYNDYSLCSLMVRYTIALAHDTSTKPLCITERPIDIQHGGQLEEYYLCDVNAKGTVPVLFRPSQLSTAIADSLEITRYLYQFYPALRPGHIAADIDDLLQRLHDINYFSLTYTTQPKRARDMEADVEKRLSDPHISARHRDALQYKLQVVKTTRAPSLDPSSVARAETQTRKFLQAISDKLAAPQRSPSKWICGTAHPTALDAHTMPFLARLIDVGRGDVLDPHVKAYADAAFRTESWQNLMQGRKTVYGGYL